MGKRHDPEKEILRTWVDIDTRALSHNARVLKKILSPHTLQLAVVKSNAYGHGLNETSAILARSGVDWLAVDSLVEALSVRRHGVTLPILVLGYTVPSLLESARKHHVSVTLSDFGQLDVLRGLARHPRAPLRVHVKVDTGMHRQGFQLTDAPRLLALLKEEHTGGRFIVEGLYTHFAKAKDPRDKDMTNRQFDEFGKWKTLFSDAGLEPLAHIGATGGALLFPKVHEGMVRYGIGLYGIWPSQETRRALEKKIALHPVLSWRALVGEVKLVKKGERVGYDGTELLMRDTVIAIIPIGYWHGFTRALSGRGRVLIHGKFARVLGRVSMNMITVDVTDIPRVKVGDIATVIGSDGKERIPVEELALLSGTTAYEILTRLNPLMKKFYQ